VHIHNHHGPLTEREPTKPAFAAFAWVVCQRESDGKFVMVNEPAGISRGRPGYWLPAGRVDAGETLVQAAKRESLEEAGISVRIEGVLRFMLDGSCPRVVLLARPLEEGAECKSVPDFESVGALWVGHEMLKELNNPGDFRSDAPLRFFPPVATGDLKPQSLDTDAFRAFEQTIASLTQRAEPTRQDIKHFFGVWEDLKHAYPASAFR
jgi:8-oxo-dGTP pyrophosphatase MutT (NUDIX family)